jgi:UDP-N-acetylmuramoyl-L-alanyl-D-glutamate--2,6-diaminopimelate ligase
MVLSELLTVLDKKEKLGNCTEDPDIQAIYFDSRRVTNHSLFIAIKGTKSDGHDFINQAIEKGAKAILIEDSFSIKSLDDSVVYFKVENSSIALGLVASKFYNFPSTKMKVVAVTGTNGKTTVATLLYELFKNLGYNCGLFSTVQNKVKDKTYDAFLTTPDPVFIHSTMAEMVKTGCTHCFMEASSHAIHQNRLAGLDIDGAIFTNISHDHLDYHGTFDNYIKAKKKLFDELKPQAFALANKDDKRGSVMLQNTFAKKYYFSLHSEADFKCKIISNTLQGLELELNGHKAWFRLVGNFNAYNLTAVFGAAVLLEENEIDVLRALSEVNPPKGRFHVLTSNKGLNAVIDYAHTPDALENVLTTLRSCIEKPTTQIITVVGCGGDRDKTKRPLMGKIASQLSDWLIITSDNPRSEDPEAIANQMLEGVPISLRKKVLKILDRKEAIKTAIALGSTHDVVLVAGKGHENYQEIQGIKYPFDDYQVVNEIFLTKNE